MRRHRLIETTWPDFGSAERPPLAELDEHLARLEALHQAMERRGLTHVVVYGDREHFANLQYLSGFDPRFEEALLVVRRDAAPLLVVGNECEGYLGVSPLHRAGRLRHRRYRSFSLVSQPREGGPRIREVLADEGVGPGARVGCVGWKYFTDEEEPGASRVIELPAFIVDALRDLAGSEVGSPGTELEFAL